MYKRRIKMGFTYRSTSPIRSRNVGRPKEVTHVVVSWLSVTTGEFVWEELLRGKRKYNRNFREVKAPVKNIEGILG